MTATTDLLESLRVAMAKMDTQAIRRPVIYLSRRAWAQLALQDRCQAAIGRRIDAKLPRGPRLRSFGRSPTRMRRRAMMIKSAATGLHAGLTSPPRPWRTLSIVQRISDL